MSKKAPNSNKGEYTVVMPSSFLKERSKKWNSVYGSDEVPRLAIRELVCEVCGRVLRVNDYFYNTLRGISCESCEKKHRKNILLGVGQPKTDGEV